MGFTIQCGKSLPDIGALGVLFGVLLGKEKQSPGSGERLFPFDLDCLFFLYAIDVLS